MKIPARRASKPRNLKANRGFTLLEVVLAVGIAIVMVLAIYQTIFMYYKQTESGREMAQQAQLVRALAARMQADLRSTFTDWKGSGTDSVGLSGSETSVPAGGVLGALDSITIVVSGIPADLDLSQNIAASVVDPKSDIRLVRYYLGSLDGVKSGLVREVYDQVPDDELGISPSPSRQDLLAEEVRELQLLYYDGAEWVEYWDDEYDTSPLAVTVRLGMLTPFAAQQLLDEAQGFQTTTSTDAMELEYFQFVVALPQNESSLPEAGAGAGAGGESGGSEGSESMGEGAGSSGTGAPR